MTKTTRDMKLAWWIDHGLNVLFRGGPGDGRVSMVESAFDHAGLRWRCFAAQAVSVESLLADTSVEAIFIDDLNRTAKKVQVAVVQLIKSKSIRDRFFPRLKIIWAAVSRTDDEGDDAGPAELDPLDAEPFDVVVSIPSQLLVER